ncbi:hypothetical protein [Longimicrobium sp.]|uniref:hypothetical protein n=1 Tax=Longimicrobium sp. TaxID=2029185 RepID=UPI002B5913E5|nr:hypothetical protein [Longimicrobium sp.]HSU15246.1 hypothetical protein [Longimicrobium sp.]
MPISRAAVVRTAIAALVLALALPRAAAAQEEPPRGERTHIDLIPYFGYAHGIAGSRDAWLGGFRIGMRTETWGVALTEQSWVIGLACNDNLEPCDDPVSTTLGAEWRVPGSLGSALIVGADAGVFDADGPYLIGGVRLGTEQALGPVAVRFESQVQKVLGLNVATVDALLGLRISFGGPRLPR